MNRLERAIDRAVPEVAVYLRLMKKRAQGDVTLRVIDALVKEKEIVVDVGAYRGVYTLQLARRVKKGGWVWAVEPLPENLRALRRRWERPRPLGLRRVGILPYAASDRSGSAELHLPLVAGHTVPACGSLSDLGVPQQAVPIELRPLDEVITGMNSSVTFMKVDVEGHEDEVLRGAARLLSYNKPSVFIEIEQRHRDSPIQQTFDFFTDLGYDGYFVLDDRLLPLGEFDLERHQPASIRDRADLEGDMPPGYVHDFLFVRSWSDRSIDSLLG